MALSIGFRIFSLLPSCYSSYGALNFYPGGTFTHCSCQPSLDAHLRGVIRQAKFEMACEAFFRVADDPAGTGPSAYRNALLSALPPCQDACVLVKGGGPGSTKRLLQK